MSLIKLPISDADAAALASFTVHPDFPKPGIQFMDVFEIFNGRHPNLPNHLLDALAAGITSHLATLPPSSGPLIIMGLESRGFLFAPGVAARLGVPFAPVRKGGKLPGKVLKAEYALEYGHAVLEVQETAIPPSSRVVLIDDLLATGGTLRAACDLITRGGGTPVLAACVYDIGFLNGAAALPVPVLSCCTL